MCVEATFCVIRIPVVVSDYIRQETHNDTNEVIYFLKAISFYKKIYRTEIMLEKRKKSIEKHIK